MVRIANEVVEAIVVASLAATVAEAAVEIEATIEVVGVEMAKRTIFMTVIETMPIRTHEV